MNKKMLFAAIILIAVLSMSFQPKKAKDDGWKPLFDGKTLNGWKVNNQDFKHPDSKPDFYVEDSMIVCNSTLNSGGGYLVTEKNYNNFILELDVKIDSLLNSGVQCRSHVWAKDTTTAYVAGDEKGTVQHPLWQAGYIWGYQIEIDPSKRSWSGGLYEPGNRGWLVTLAGNETARNAFRRMDWNHLRIVMDHEKIQVWVNGILTINTKDDMSTSGFIGLQFHQAYKKEQENMKSMWKNIRIKELK